MTDLFCQSPPRLGNQYDTDRVLRSIVRRRFAECLSDVEQPLREMGELAGVELYSMQVEDRLNEPRLTQWDPWGNRIDRIELSPLWRRVEPLAAEFGLVATGYEQEFGASSRSLQFALAYLFHPSSDVYTCPLAMTDGAAATLNESGNMALIDHAVPHLVSRDPAFFWTSGQWMTEAIGGSDVGASESIAVQASEDEWQISGRKWFTSAATSQIALTLARPQGNPEGGRGLALFYLETRDDDGQMNGITVARLKDKLGTRKVPTAELLLDKTRARMVGEPRNGVRQIVPMLTMTRTWNSVCAAATMRRGLALASDYAQRRQAFGVSLAEQPLHLDTLAGLQARTAGATLMCFRLTDLIGARETDGLSEADDEQLRVLSSLTKLTTARQAVAVSSEILEAFGGAGYVEDTGLPVLLRDGQVLPIWEGTTNVLALDLLRAIEDIGGIDALLVFIRECASLVSDKGLAEIGEKAVKVAAGADTWLRKCADSGDPRSMQAGARRFALSLGHAVQLALLCEQGQWALDHENDGHLADCAKLLAAQAIEPPDSVDLDRIARVAMNPGSR